jgi:hypothetical protein
MGNVKLNEAGSSHIGVANDSGVLGCDTVFLEDCSAFIFRVRQFKEGSV